MTVTLGKTDSIKLLKDKDCAIRTVNMEIDTLEKLRDNLGESLSTALDAMQYAKGRIIITGMGQRTRLSK